MINNVYIEEDLVDSEITLKILKKLGDTEKIICEKYTDVFNKKSQNFKLQKTSPSLIIAKKKGNFLNKIPNNFSIGGEENYYFSHMLNCIYDCRYCFLQGMYNSANFVLFINFNDFKSEIIKKIDSVKNKEIHFFSGYDCDSLAMEPLTGFAHQFINLFKNKTNTLLELRTKSTQINFLLDKTPISNVIVAFTLSPDEIVKLYEKNTPSLDKRIKSISSLQSKGWKVGLRFDPIIFSNNYRSIYSSFFRKVFTSFENKKIHSVTLGTLRMPVIFFKKIQKLHSNEKNLFSKLFNENKQINYQKNIDNEVTNFCMNSILKYIPKDKIFLNK